MKYWIKFIASFWLLALPFTLTANDLADFDFSRVAQGHTADGSCSAYTDPYWPLHLIQNNNATINGLAPEEPLNFCNSNTGEPWSIKGCDDGEEGLRRCTLNITYPNNALKSVDLDNFINNNGGASIGSCSAEEELTISKRNSQIISLYSTCTLEFKSKSTYVVKGLNFGGGAEVTLNSGEYWFNSLTINNDGLLTIQGDVILNVQSSIAFNSSKIRISKGGSLTIIGYDNVNLTGSASIEANVYAAKVLTLNNDSIIHGNTLSSELVMNGNSAINGASTYISPSVHHLQLTHDGNGVTCNPEAITLKACNNESCSETLTSQTIVKLDSSQGQIWSGAGVDNNQVTFSGGETTIYLQKTTPGNIALNIVESSPPTEPLNRVICDRVDGGVSDSELCTIHFAEVGLEVYVPDHIANSKTGGYIQAIKASDQNPLQCEPLKVTGSSVKLWSNYLTPDSSEIINAQQISIDGVSVNNENTPPSTHTLSFDDNGKATFELRYPDAGKLQLSAQYRGSGNNSGLALEGSTQFVSAPKGLTITASRSSGSGAESEPSGCPTTTPDPTCFAAAGEAFELNVTAYGEGGVPTPNYAQNGLTLTHTLTAPASGVPGELGRSSYNHTQASGSTNKINQTVSEVGEFRFTVTPPQTGYLGSTASTAIIPQATSATIGRFVPAYLQVSGNIPELKPACGNFTYMSQPFGFDTPPTLTVKGMSKNGSETKNYQKDSSWRYTPNWNTRSYTMQPSARLLTESGSNGLATPTVTVNNTEPRTITLENALLRYTKPVLPIPPLSDSLTFSLSSADIKDTDGICYRNSATSPCQGFSFDPTPPSTHYWGQLVMENTYGPETNPLRQMLYAQYYNEEARFELNRDDSCTDLPVSDFTFVVNGSEQNANSISLGSGLTQAEVAQQPSNSGEGYLLYSAPGIGNQGLIEVIANLGQLPWMVTNDSNGDGAINLLDNQTIQAQAQFGIYRGSDRIIWWKERLD